jgi:hypothetical protein
MKSIKEITGRVYNTSTCQWEYLVKGVVHATHDFLPEDKMKEIDPHVWRRIFGGDHEA